MKFYHYPNCSSCRKAKAFLTEHGCQTMSINIVEQPPSKAELHAMLGYYDGQLRKLFNTAGGLYREMKLKDRLATMSEDEALDLLAEHGMLVKRPFLIDRGRGLVGFKPAEWQTFLDLTN